MITAAANVFFNNLMVIPNDDGLTPILLVHPGLQKHSNDFEHSLWPFGSLSVLSSEVQMMLLLCILCRATANQVHREETHACELVIRSLCPAKMQLHLAWSYTVHANNALLFKSAVSPHSLFFASECWFGALFIRHVTDYTWTGKGRFFTLVLAPETANFLTFDYCFNMQEVYIWFFFSMLV